MIGKSVSFYVYDDDGNEILTIGIVESTFYEDGDPREACVVLTREGKVYTPDTQEVRIIEG